MNGRRVSIEGVIEEKMVCWEQETHSAPSSFQGFEYLLQHKSVDFSQENVGMTPLVL